jgi:hypothetical protein
MNVEHVNTWSKLAGLAAKLPERKWLFRGESQHGRALKPKAGRVEDALKAEYNPDHERAALALFKRQARPYLKHTPITDTEWLAVAQHHGMHTRLLDWTESLLVAAFFAVEKAGTSGDPIIYGICDVPDLSSDEEKDPFSATRVVVYRAPHIAPRIPAQSSVFTLHPNPTERFAPEQLRLWQINRTACMSIKRALDACAINYSTIFPDLDGLARYIGWRYKWGKFV